MTEPTKTESAPLPPGVAGAGSADRRGLGTSALSQGRQLRMRQQSSRSLSDFALLCLKEEISLA
jgi:hypothetical protein